MNRRALYALLALALVWAGFRWGMGRLSTAETQHEQKASEAKGRADEHKAAGGVADAAAAEAARRAQSAEAAVARLKRELDALRRPQPVPPGPDVPAPAPVDLAPEVAKRDQIIEAQDAHITALKIEVGTLTTARDHWRSAEQARADQVLHLEAALEAQKAISRGSLWRGRVQGLAIGLGAGYVAGRTH